MTKQSLGDDQLVITFLDGDAAAMGSIYERYADSLYDFCLRSCGSPARAADAVQDTFMTAMERLGDLRDQSALRPWLYAIARNNLNRSARDRSVATDLDTIADVVSVEPSPEQEAATAESRALIEAALDGLDERDRMALLLSDRVGLSGAELATALDVRQDHTYTLVANARSRFERSVGTVLVRRDGQDGCVELQRIADDIGEPLTPRLRKSIAGHIDNCEICEETKRKGVRAERSLLALPLLRAPSSIRTKLGFDGAASIAAPSLSPSESSVSTAAAASSSSGFAISLPLVASIVGLLAVLGVVGFLAFGNGDSTDPTDVAAPVTVPAANDVAANATATLDPEDLEASSATANAEAEPAAATPRDEEPARLAEAETTAVSTPTPTDDTASDPRDFCDLVTEGVVWFQDNQGPAGSDPQSVELYFRTSAMWFAEFDANAPAELAESVGRYRGGIDQIVSELESTGWSLSSVPDIPELVGLRDFLEIEITSRCDLPPAS